MPTPTSAAADKLARFDHLLDGATTVNPWEGDGGFTPDAELLRAALVEAVGTSQRSGVVAGAVDVWAAQELRRAGFDADTVWPRRTQPRVLPRDVRRLLEALPSDLRARVEERFTQKSAKKALPTEAHVVGRAFRKQADVLVASWESGVELLISTKTMLSSYQKNLRNRFEEGYGDAKNLRGRHPQAALGFLFVVGADIPDSSLEFAVDMLRKLTLENDVYDAACLLVLSGLRVEESEAEEDDAASADVLDATPGLFEGDTPAESEEANAVELRLGSVPSDLGPARFFRVLTEAALERMPFEAYPGVRDRRREAGL